MNLYLCISVFLYFRWPDHIVFVFLFVITLRPFRFNSPGLDEDIHNKTAYLIFVISFTLAGFLNLNILHPKITKNTQKLQQIAPKSVKYAVYWVQSGKIYNGQIFSYASSSTLHPRQ